MDELKTGKKPGPAAGDSIHGYFVKREVPMKEISAVFHELEHEATGARHIHIANDD